MNADPGANGGESGGVNPDVNPDTNPDVNRGTSQGTGPRAPRLRRDPRPYAVHVAVDALIGFCVTAFLLWLFGVPLWAMIVIAWVLGLAAAPFTRRWEQRQLDERDTPAP